MTCFAEVTTMDRFTMPDNIRPMCIYHGDRAICFDYQSHIRFWVCTLRQAGDVPDIISDCGYSLIREAAGRHTIYVSSESGSSLINDTEIDVDEHMEPGAAGGEDEQPMEPGAAGGEDEQPMEPGAADDEDERPMEPSVPASGSAGPPNLEELDALQAIAARAGVLMELSQLQAIAASLPDID